MRRNMQRLAAGAAVGALALGGCAGGSEDSGSTATSTPQQERTEAGSDRESAASAESAGDSADSGAGSDSAEEDSSSTKSDSSMKAPAGTHLARSAGLTITVEDVERASAEVRSAADGAGGYVSSEESRIADDADGTRGSGSSRDSTTGSSDVERRPRSGTWAEIVVTVPVDELDSTITSLAEVGTVTQRTSDTEDLTKKYTDTKARVRTMEKSIDRLRGLIDDTDDLEQIVTLEDELSEREADLESMVSQEKSLEKRTTTAPISVSLVSPEAAEEAEKETEETGFVAGLDRGWSGFTSALTVGLTVLGAVTPFALTALVVLGPVVWWLRRRLRDRSTPAEAPSAG